MKFNINVKMSGEARWVLVNHTKRQYYKGGELKEGCVGTQLLRLLRFHGWNLNDIIEEDNDDEGYNKFEWMEDNDDGKYDEIDL